MPRPHTLPECCQMFFKNRETIVPGTFISSASTIVNSTRGLPLIQKTQPGAYGSIAKRSSRNMKMDLHHYFNSLEHGLTKTSRGEDYLLVTESSLEGLVRDKVGNTPIVLAGE